MGAKVPGRLPDREFWKDRRVLVTGHTGFKGAWLCLWLDALGAQVTGLALPAPDDQAAYPALGPWTHDSIIQDLRDPAGVAKAIDRASPEVVFHLAAQSLVGRGHRVPLETFAVNVMGTAHLLDALRDRGDSRVQAVVIATTDKVYANDDSGRAFREDDPLGGSEPYGGSKACVEIMAHCWPAGENARPLPIVTARAGNVVGGGDHGPDRLLPDARRALLAGSALQVRRPRATRPWQFVLDPLLGYLLFAELLAAEPEQTPPALNFGPPSSAALSVADVLDLAFAGAGEGRWEPAAAEYPESELLRLDPALAAEKLGWRCRLDTPQAVSLTTRWWQAQDRDHDMRAFSSEQLDDYVNAVEAHPT